MKINLHIDTADQYLHPPLIAACEEALTFAKEIFDRATAGLDVAGLPAPHLHEWGSVMELCCNQVIVVSCSITPGSYGSGGVEMEILYYPNGRPADYPVDPVFGWET